VNQVMKAAEWVFPGHPDKLCDAIADAVVEEAVRRDPFALVGVEAAVHRRSVHVTGRVAGVGAETIPVDVLVRAVYASAGFDDRFGPAPEDLVVGGDLVLEAPLEGEAEIRGIAVDQAVCIGWANDLPGAHHVPVEHALARAVARGLHALRREAPELALGPDGKVLVVLAEASVGGATVRRLDALHVSLQQGSSGDAVALHRAVRRRVEDVLKHESARIPGLSPKPPDRLSVVGAGIFEVGGPHGDNGLTGKKTVVDAYGPRVAIGGGALSGKDFFKVDRAGALHARRLAKCAVALGFASEVRVELGWFPGDREARLLGAYGPSDAPLDLRALAARTDLSLARSGESFFTGGLVERTRWGAFFDVEAPWEVLPRW
jgi:S-adenosylmethionine synthetase